MRIHLVSGFLGSGKTTAISLAAKHLISTGKRVGVITNDQGKLLIDTAFFSLERVPTVEVNGGCFCCNYLEFDSKINYFIQTLKPDYIFAESVGSCADVVATVMKPLIEFKMVSKEETSLSVFTDVRLLEKYLLNEELPFQEGVIYIFEKQIEEADLLIMNKSDLFHPSRLQNLLRLTELKYPSKRLLVNSSMIDDNITNWLQVINTQNTFPHHRLEINYQTYGVGEQSLTWYDANIKIAYTNAEFHKWMDDFINRLLKTLNQMNIRIGHLKFLLDDGVNHQKISVISEVEIDRELSWTKGFWHSPVNFMINARLECRNVGIESIIRSLLTSNLPAFMHVEITDEKAFQPGFPKPTYRLN